MISEDLTANMAALLERADVQQNEIQSHINAQYTGLRSRYSEVAEMRPGRTRSVPRVYDWPGSDPVIMAIGMCEAIAVQSREPLISKLVGADVSEENKGKALYDLLSTTPYWALSHHLQLTDKQRKLIAISNDVAISYIWPKEDVQFIYIVKPTAPQTAYNLEGSKALVGVFVVSAERNDLTVRDAQVFRLMDNGDVTPFNRWQSHQVGISENHLVMYCNAPDDEAAEGGMIYLKRRPLEELVVKSCNVGNGILANSTGAYSGQFGTLGPGSNPRRGKIYCERLAAVLPQEKYQPLFKNIFSRLLKKLD